MDSDRMLSVEFMEAHPMDAARILEPLGADEIASFLKDIPVTLSAGVIKYLDPLTAVGCLKAMDVEKSAAVVAKLPMEIASSLLRRIKKDEREAILKGLPEAAAVPLRVVLNYPEGTAGALMDPGVFTLPDDITVKEASGRMKRHPENLSYDIFVLNREHLLVGTTTVRQILLAPPAEMVSSITRRHTSRLFPHMDLKTLLQAPGWKEFDTLPVIDEKGVFLGAVEHRKIHQLAFGARTSGAEGVREAVIAFAELYWVSLSALLSVVGSTLYTKED